MEIRNAKITSTMLGREDHGILTFMVFVEFGCSGCGNKAVSFAPLATVCAAFDCLRSRRSVDWVLLL